MVKKRKKKTKTKTRLEKNTKYGNGLVKRKEKKGM